DMTLSEKDKTLTLLADDDFKMNALWEIIQGRLVRRGVPTQNFKVPPSEPAREIVKFIKEKKLKKVQAAIQADQVRVTSPSKDDLQEAMRALREHDFGVALQFG